MRKVEGLDLAKLGQLAVELQQHDYYYNYSDDHRVYMAGVTHWADIQILAQSLGWHGLALKQWYIAFMLVQQKDPKLERYHQFANAQADERRDWLAEHAHE